MGHWRRLPRRQRPNGAAVEWSLPTGAGADYSYALGLYLGDGHIVRHGASAWMRITLDAAYPEIASEAVGALAAVFPDSRVTRRTHPSHGRIDVQISSAALVLAFPQCGPGRKHERTITLAPWQRQVTHAHPRALVRGLIHSDGCRTTNRFTTVGAGGERIERAYTRYFFSNLSADIRAIFCEHCDLLGIRWSLSNPRNVSVARRESVALLDEFVGPKR